MNDKLIILLADIFNKRVEDGKDGFLIIKSSVAVKVLSSLYERLILVDVPCIQSLTKEEKEKYWDISKQFYDIEADAIKGSKAAYIIALITNSN